MRSRHAARGVLVLVLTSAMVITTFLAPTSQSPVRATLAGDTRPYIAGTFVGWRDDFINTTYVGASSGLAITGTDVQLPGRAMQRRGLALGVGGPGEFDSQELGDPSVLFDGAGYRMWYYGCTPGFLCQIGYASSPDGQLWTKQGVVLSPSLPLEGSILDYPQVLKIDTTYRMWYSAYDGAAYRIFAANSTDGVNWTKQGLVLDVGTPGSYDDRYVFDAAVLYQGGSYDMWYSASRVADPSHWVIMLATSTDGLSWTRQGVVLGPGPAGALDEVRANSPAVRLAGTRREMLYTGVDVSGTERLLVAESADGVTWERIGMVLDVLPPNESPIVTLSTFVIETDGSWSVYYTARGSQFQIYQATRPLPGPQTGWLRSSPVNLPQGLTWAWFNQTADIPQNTSLNLSVLDGQSLLVIPGFQNITSRPIELVGISPSTHGSLVLVAWLHGDGNSTPVLDSWEVSWTDSAPPTFIGLSTATDMGTGGSVHLSWLAGSDPSPPLTYSIYVAAGSSGYDFGRANATTAGSSLDLTALVNGVLYGVIVRASDRWGNQDQNTVTKTVVPTTPVDSTPPDFAGLASATDTGTGGAVRLAWLPAVDPDTPASNTDPSLPIQYFVFVASSGGNFNFAAPTLITENTSAVVTDLTDGTTYRFMVRAMDHQGNLEGNTVVQSALPTHADDDVPPTFSGVDGAMDQGDGSSVLISWNAATDPDTPQSHSDPSLPITYYVYVSENASALGTEQPRVSTQATTTIVTGLQPGRTYYVLVRSSDAAGNRDLNQRIVSFQVATPWWAYWWVFVLVAGFVGTAGYLEFRRRRRRQPPAG